MLLDDLLGISDPDVALPQIDPDARRRRLSAMVKAAATRAERHPTVYVIEDAHWIDGSASRCWRSSSRVMPPNAVAWS